MGSAWRTRRGGLASGPVGGGRGAAGVPITTEQHVDDVLALPVNSVSLAVSCRCPAGSG